MLARRGPGALRRALHLQLGQALLDPIPPQGVEWQHRPARIASGIDPRHRLTASGSVVGWTFGPEDEEERGMKPSFRSCALAGFWFTAASLVALQAGAQSTAEYDRNGPYLMLGGGYSFQNFSGVGPLNVDDSPNLIFEAGWRLHVGSEPED